MINDLCYTFLLMPGSLDRGLEFESSADVFKEVFRNVYNSCCAENLRSIITKNK